MGPEARLRKAFELTAFARALLRTGLERRFPHLGPEALRQLERERLAQCRKRIS